MIQINQVSKAYGSIAALDNIDLHIEAGSCYGLLGPNGAGKSTLMKIIVGVLLSYDGDVQIGSYTSRQDRNQINRIMGYVPQDICLEETLSARDNLQLFGKLYGLSGKPLQARIRNVLEQIGLSERAGDKVQSYSGGMKRRLNIGCALLHEPSVIVLDEPTVGIDPQSRNAIFSLVRELQSAGSTLIYSSHYMEEVEQLCDHVGLIDEGKLVENGSLKQVLHRHSQASVFVAGEGLDEAQLAAFGQAQSQNGGFILAGEEPLAVMERMAAHFREQAVLPDRLELYQPRLEHIFFELTGKHLRDKQ